MKHGTAKFIDWMILKPVAVFYGPVLILYGIFSSKGSWLHILMGIFGITVVSMIGGALYPKATPSDLASGRAWNDIGPDNEDHGKSIDVDIPNIKTRLNKH